MLETKNALRIRKKLDSETLPELKAWLGRKSIGASPAWARSASPASKPATTPVEDPECWNP